MNFGGHEGFHVVLKALLLLFLFLPWQARAGNTDLCGEFNGKKLTVDVGEAGIIEVTNVTYGEDNFLQDGSTSTTTERIPQRCSLTLIACPSCHFLLNVVHMNIPTCAESDTANACRCDYVWIKEPTFGKSARELCGFLASNESTLAVSPVTFTSKTKILSIDFIYSSSYNDAFAIRYKVLRNMFNIYGVHGYYHSNNSGIIESPHFPQRYPSDYSAIYQLENLDPHGFVQLLFTDFQLAPWSYIEVKDSDGKKLGIYDGSLFRPPALISSGPSLTVKFKANDDYPSLGFRARYTFVNYPEKFWQLKPNTECGGYLEGPGGVITLVGGTATPAVAMVYDCVWVLQPRPLSTHSHLAIRVAKFHDLGPKSVLEIRQGTTSSAFLLESLSGYHHHHRIGGKMTPHTGGESQELIVSASTGFYVRLHGYFSNFSHLVIVYTAFRYQDCYGNEDFRCENSRCIKNTLHCDGFNHCGDGSDETSCFGPNGKGSISAGSGSRWWHSPSYYYPGTSQVSQRGASGTSTLILVTSLAGLGMFLLTTITILIKLHRSKNRVPSRACHGPTVRTISGREDIRTDAGFNHFDGTGAAATAANHLYDAPPPYDEVVKVCTPPPAYHSIAHSAQQTGCFDNVGYLPDPLAQDTRRVPPLNKPHLLRIPLIGGGIRNSHNRSVAAVRNLFANSFNKDSPSQSTSSQSRPDSSIYRSERVKRGSPLAHLPPSYQSLSLPRNLLSLKGAVPTKAPRRSPLPLSLCQCKGACSCPLQPTASTSFEPILQSVNEEDSQSPTKDGSSTDCSPLSDLGVGEEEATTLTTLASSQESGLSNLSSPPTTETVLSMEIVAAPLSSRASPASTPPTEVQMLPITSLVLHSSAATNSPQSEA